MINRRRFLTFTSGCFLAAGAGAWAASGAIKLVDVGALKDFAEDGISEKFVRHNFFVTRHGGRLFATIATCPHKGNFLLRDPQDPSRIICSGHDSVFDPRGMPVSGRVKKGLTRFGIRVNEKGRVLVDPNKQFAQKQWDQKDSFVTLAGRKPEDKPAE